MYVCVCGCGCMEIGQYSLYFWLKDTSTTYDTSLIFLYISVCLYNIYNVNYYV